MLRVEQLSKAHNSASFLVDDVRAMYSMANAAEMIVLEDMLTEAVKAKQRLKRLLDDIESFESESREGDLKND